MLKYNYSTHIFCKHPEASSYGWYPAFFNKRSLSAKHISSKWKHSENTQAILTVKMRSLIFPLSSHWNHMETSKRDSECNSSRGLESLPKLWDILTHIKWLCFSAVVETKTLLFYMIMLVIETLLWNRFLPIILLNGIIFQKCLLLWIQLQLQEDGVP